MKYYENHFTIKHQYRVDLGCRNISHLNHVNLRYSEIQCCLTIDQAKKLVLFLCYNVLRQQSDSLALFLINYHFLILSTTILFQTFIVDKKTKYIQFFAKANMRLLQPE